MTITCSPRAICKAATQCNMARLLVRNNHKKWPSAAPDCSHTYKLLVYVCVCAKEFAKPAKLSPETF